MKYSYLLLSTLLLACINSTTLVAKDYRQIQTVTTEFRSDTITTDTLTKKTLSGASLLAVPVNPNTFPSSGNAGIGTTVPTEKLEIVDGFLRIGLASFGHDINNLGDNSSPRRNYISFGADRYATAIMGSNIYLENVDKTTITNLRIAKTHPTLAGGGIIIQGAGQPNQGSIFFYTSVPGSVTENSLFTQAPRMMIAPSGQVSIGMTVIDANHLFSVKGKIRAQEMKVEIANWPDYVFYKGYKLPSLLETEIYIKEKGHLPGIPSAEDVKNNGIHLGEMNAKLLQKIEELTLFLIEKEKQIKELEIRLSKVESKTL